MPQGAEGIDAPCEPDLASWSSVNVGVTVFVSVRTSTHTKAWFDRFKAAVEVIPEARDLRGTWHQFQRVGH